MPLMAEAAAQHHQQQTTTVPHALHTDHFICSSTHICSSYACTKHYHTYYIGPQYNAATETHVMIILCTHHPNTVDWKPNLSLPLRAVPPPHCCPRAGNVRGADKQSLILPVNAILEGGGSELQLLWQQDRGAAVIKAVTTAQQLYWQELLAAAQQLHPSTPIRQLSHDSIRVQTLGFSATMLTSISVVQLLHLHQWHLHLQLYALHGLCSPAPMHTRHLGRARCALNELVRRPAVVGGLAGSMASRQPSWHTTFDDQHASARYGQVYCDQGVHVRRLRNSRTTVCNATLFNVLHRTEWAMAMHVRYASDETTSNSSSSTSISSNKSPGITMTSADCTSPNKNRTIT
jgi:hypothetical protein